MTQRIAIYPGTFDPITNGHLDILRRSLRLFDKVIVALAENIRKAPLFTIEERRAQILGAIDSDPRVEVESFSGLLVEYARRRGAPFMVRGLRALGDFEYEFQLAHMNRHLAREVETVFMMTAEENFYVSSSLVKEVAQFGGDISALVPAGIDQALQQRIARGRTE